MLTRRDSGAVLLCVCLAGGAGVARAQAKDCAVQAFDRFIHEREERQAERAGGALPFLWAEESSGRMERLRQGQIVVEPLTGRGIRKVPEGLIHNWIGAVFIPGATLETAFPVLRDYGNYKNIYGPDVTDSKLLSRNGNEFRISMRVVKRKVVTLAFDAEYDIKYFRVSDSRWHSRSYSTRISDVENLGRPGEREQPKPGMLWRLYSYSRFEQRDGGLYIECEGISLSRPFPTGLGWIIEPIVRNGARTALLNLLTSTRAAVEKRERELRQASLSGESGTR